MISDLLFSGLAANAATAAVILAASRPAFHRRPLPMLSATICWLQLPTHHVVLLLALLATASGLCFAQITADTRHEIGFSSCYQSSLGPSDGDNGNLSLI